jgi:hypothetical protein
MSRFRGKSLHSCRSSEKLPANVEMGNTFALEEHAISHVVCRASGVIMHLERPPWMS